MNLTKITCFSSTSVLYFFFLILYFLLLLLLFLFIPLEIQAEEKNYDIALESRIHGSSEQPKMIFIMPWRSQIHQNVFLKKNINGYFDALLEPKSKIDLKYEQELMLKQSKQPE